MPHDELISQLLFHPRPEEPGYSPRGMPTETRSGGVVVHGYLHENRSSDVLLLFFHGNGEIAADYDLLRSIYTSCGASFWVVDYRGYGRSTGTPSFTSMLRDAEAVLDDVPRIAAHAGRQFKQVVVMGRSLGSAAAIHLASTRPESLAGLILDSPYADGLALIRRLGGSLPETTAPSDLLDNLNKICACTLPCLIIHGAADKLIPPHEAEALHETCRSSSKEILTIPGGGHNDLLAVGFDDYRRKLSNFIARTNLPAAGG